MQSSKQEISDGLTQCVDRAIMEYNARNRELPERIIIYRDGVGDGQLQYIHEHELPQIKTFIGRANILTFFLFQFLECYSYFWSSIPIV